MFHKRLLRLAVPAVAIAGLLFAACGGDDDDTGNGGNGGGESPTATAVNGNGDNGGETPADTVTEITVEMHDNFFEPDNFSVKVGETITITAPNVGAAVHNMVVIGADGEERLAMTDMMVQAGEESVFEVTFDTAGTYDFQCDYHMPDMVGTIVVVD